MFNKTKLSPKTNWRKPFLLGSLSLIAGTVIFVACNKVNTSDNSADEKVILPKNVQDVKSWFNNSFKSSPNFGKTVQSYGSAQNDAAKTTFASFGEAKTLVNNGVVKIPVWRKASEHQIGSKTFVEVPTMVQNEVFYMLSKEKIDDNQRNAIRKARQNRVIFNTNAKSGYNKKVITILPSYSYLQSHNFDISNISFFDLKKNNFEGHVIIKNWNEKIEKYLIFKGNGKTQKLHIKNKMESLANNLKEKCHSEFQGYECHPKNTCIRIGDEVGPCGSLPHDEWVCEPVYEEVCEEVEDDDVDYDLCKDAPDPAQCICDNYGVGCNGDDDGDGNGDDEIITCSSSVVTDFFSDIENSSSPKSILSSTEIIEENMDTRKVDYTWEYYGGPTFTKLSTETAVLKKSITLPGKWEFEDMYNKEFDKETGFIPGGTCTTKLLNPYDLTRGKFTYGLQIKFEVQFEFLYKIKCKGKLKTETAKAVFLANNP